MYIGGGKEHYFNPKGFFEQDNFIMWFTHDNNLDSAEYFITKNLKQDMSGIEFDSLFILNPIRNERIYVY